MDRDTVDHAISQYYKHSAMQSIAERLFPKKSEKLQNRLYELQIKQAERALDYPEDSFDLASNLRGNTGYPLGGVAAAALATASPLRVAPRSRAENLAPITRRATMLASNPFAKSASAKVKEGAFSAFDALKRGASNVRPTRIFRLWR